MSTQIPRKYFLVAVHAFLWREGKVLLSQRANTGYMDGWFSVPAGHVDGGETIWSAMKREVSEEVGILLNSEQQPTHAMHRIKTGEQNERIDYFFMIEDWEGEPSNCEPEKCSQLLWCDPNHLPENIIPYVAFALGQIDARQPFSEFDE